MERPFGNVCLLRLMLKRAQTLSAATSSPSLSLLMLAWALGREAKMKVCREYAIRDDESMLVDVSSRTGGFRFHRRDNNNNVIMKRIAWGKAGQGRRGEMVDNMMQAKTGSFKRNTVSAARSSADGQSLDPFAKE